MNVQMVVKGRRMFSYMTKMEMVSRYTDLARQRSELFLQSGSCWNTDTERQEKAILNEMAALEAAIKLPVQALILKNMQWKCSVQEAI